MSGEFSYFPAPAKLNLFLHITGRRVDGYHTLQSVFRFVDYCDEVGFRLRRDDGIHRLGPIAGIAEDQDLTLRAARLLQSVRGCRLGGDIAVDKRLPVGGGLGGGSSDAATTLIVLNELWGLGLSRSRLQQIALQLGADVPVFIFGRSAFAEGVGERLQAIELDPAWYLVLVPQVTVSTAEIFAARELTRNTKAIRIAAFSVGEGHNDLQPVACERFPEIARHLNWLGKFGPAAMTGSGACVFCAFGSELAAQSVLGQLPTDMKGFVARGLDRHPLYVESG
jgi:4-diphosphocytidyl-2-C-methyl-D-erythritol kinase